MGKFVNVLGSRYSVKTNNEAVTFDGRCSFYTKEIELRPCEKMLDSDSDERARKSRYKEVIRHELVHAFLFESGLGCDSVWHVAGQEHPEQTVDWIALQFPKILKAFQTVGAL
jgi:hypothetical protein